MSIRGWLYSPVEVVCHLDHEPGLVWATLAEPRTYPSWLVGAQRIRHVDSDFPAPAATFDHAVGPAQSPSIDDQSEAIAADPPHHLALHVHVGPLAFRVDFHVADDDTGSVVTFRERPTGWATAFTPLFRPILHWRNATSLRRLRGLLVCVAR